MKHARLAFLTAAFFGLFTLAACGGGNSIITPPPPPPPPPPQLHVVSGGFSAIPSNMSFNAPTKAKASDSDSAFSRLFKFTHVVEAQNPATLTITGNYSGFCPVPFIQSAEPSAIVFYGAGSFGTPDSTNAGVNCTNDAPTANGGNSPGQNAALNGEQSPALVIGSGTLTGFVIADSATSIAVNASSGLGEVWDIRGSAVNATGITCTLGQTQHRCEDTVHTFAVQDGDGVVVTFTSQPGDAPTNIQFYLGKQ